MFIDGVHTTLNKIEYACSYGGCRGSMPIVHIYLDEGISMEKLDLIEEELQEAEAFRVKYFTL